MIQRVQFLYRWVMRIVNGGRRFKNGGRCCFGRVSGQEGGGEGCAVGSRRVCVCLRVGRSVVMESAGEKGARSEERCGRRRSEGRTNETSEGSSNKRSTY